MTFEWNQWENRKTKGSTNRSCQILKGIWQHLSCRCWIEKCLGDRCLSSFCCHLFGHGKSQMSFWAPATSSVIMVSIPKIHCIQSAGSSQLVSIGRNVYKHGKCSAFLGYLHLRFAWFTLKSRSSWVCHLPTATDSVWHFPQCNPFHQPKHQKPQRKICKISSQSPNSSRLGGPRFSTTQGHSSTAIL